MSSCSCVSNELHLSCARHAWGRKEGRAPQRRDSIGNQTNGFFDRRAYQFEARVRQQRLVLCKARKPPLMPAPHSREKDIGIMPLFQDLAVFVSVRGDSLDCQFIMKPPDTGQ